LPRAWNGAIQLGFKPQSTLYDRRLPTVNQSLQMEEKWTNSLEQTNIHLVEGRSC
jgi:hypothetical protein